MPILVFYTQFTHLSLICVIIELFVNPLGGDTIHHRRSSGWRSQGLLYSNPRYRRCSSFLTPLGRKSESLVRSKFPSVCWPHVTRPLFSLNFYAFFAGSADRVVLCLVPVLSLPLGSWTSAPTGESRSGTPQQLFIFES